ncbi:NUDIX hydrolase [Candidatus Beckwithbacteria bacterium]|nr:NUDIX hydrolase [Candidatus Beckwithbacteria bacterium]
MKKNSQLISSKQIFSCPWFSISYDILIYPNGTQGDYYIFKREYPFVAVLAIENKQILVLRQWRATIRDWVWEIPMGAVNRHETPLQAAKRELLEETGYKAKKWQKLGENYVGPGHTDTKGFVFLATDLQKITGKAEKNPKEIIEVYQISCEKFEKMIQNNQLKDGPSMSSYLLYKLKK